MMTTAPPPAGGTECKMGDTEVCTCASTGTEGVHQCKADARSSMGGFFATECTNCKPPVVMPPDDPGDVMMRDAGTAGSSGGSGSSSSGSGGSSGGSGGRGGSGGSGGSTGGTRPGTCMPACTNTCFPVGILPCCRPIGGCGCTWAPGAYCL